LKLSDTQLIPLIKVYANPHRNWVSASASYHRRGFWHILAREFHPSGGILSRSLKSLETQIFSPPPTGIVAQTDPVLYILPKTI